MGSSKEKLQEAVKIAMKNRDSARLGVLRMVMAAIKQKEVDERIALGDAEVLAVLDKMIKERRESIKQFEAGQRQDLIDKETFEISVLQEFMPTPLTTAEIETAIAEAFRLIAPRSMQDMGKIMAHLKPMLQGKADMAEVSQLIKNKLTAG